MLEGLKYRAGIVVDKIPEILTGEKAFKETVRGYVGEQEARIDAIIRESIRRRSLASLSDTLSSLGLEVPEEDLPFSQRPIVRDLVQEGMMMEEQLAYRDDIFHAVNKLIESTDEELDEEFRNASGLNGDYIESGVSYTLISRSKMSWRDFGRRKYVISTDVREGAVGVEPMVIEQTSWTFRMAVRSARDIVFANKFKNMQF